MNLIVTILEQGLIYGILSLGLYITYKILDFPDLTVDGSFPAFRYTSPIATRSSTFFLFFPFINCSASRRGLSGKLLR